MYFSRPPIRRRIVVPLVLLSIPAAAGIRTVTAFLYKGLAALPDWDSTLTELRVAGDIFALGFLLFTLMLKVAVPISLGEFMRRETAGEQPTPLPQCG